MDSGIGPLYESLSAATLTSFGVFIIDHIRRNNVIMTEEVKRVQQHKV